MPTDEPQNPAQYLRQRWSLDSCSLNKDALLKICEKIETRLAAALDLEIQWAN